LIMCVVRVRHAYGALLDEIVAKARNVRFLFKEEDFFLEKNKNVKARNVRHNSVFFLKRKIFFRIEQKCSPKLNYVL